jgi:cytoskeletal protein CcmA (bactofilin family)
MNMFNKKGSVLIFVYAVIFILLSLSASVIAHSILERKAFEITKQRAEAFYVAEAGMDSALAALKTSSSYGGTGGIPVSVSRDSIVIGQYETTVVDVGSSLRNIVITSYVPQKTVTSGVLRQTCKAEGVARVSANPPPPSFYANAIYSAGEVEFTGNSYDVTGNVVYADTISNAGRVSGTVSHDITISPLAQFDFSAMRTAAVAQGNLYTAARLASGAAFPTGFWYTAPSDPSDPTTGVPNVVYVEGDMTLHGNVTAGGFFLVVGNVLTNPDVTSDTEITGNVTVNGCIYSTGEFELKGGGNSLNVNGGIWAGDEAEFTGNAKVAYNTDFMAAVKHFVDNASSGTIQLLSWRQLELYN